MTGPNRPDTAAAPNLWWSPTVGLIRGATNGGYDDAVRLVLATELAERDATIARVRALHCLDEEMSAATGRDCCKGCATSVTHSRWPCKTIRALDASALSGTTDTPPARVDFAHEDCRCCEISWRLCRGLADKGFARCCSDCTHTLTTAADTPTTEDGPDA